MARWQAHSTSQNTGKQPISPKIPVRNIWSIDSIPSITTGTPTAKDLREIVFLAPDSNALPDRPEPPAELLALADPETDILVSKSMNPDFLPQKPGRPFGVKVANLDEYPAFRGFEKVYWEYMGNSANPWEERSYRVRDKAGKMLEFGLSPTRADAFELTFARQTASGGVEFRKVIARPMFKAKTQAEADQLYQERYRDYQAAVQQRQAEIAEREATLKAPRRSSNCLCATTQRLGDSQDRFHFWLLSSLSG